MAQQKYTEQDVDYLRETYTKNPTPDTVKALAEHLEKSVNSVRAKLVSMGVYVAPEKPARQAKEEGPSKKELVQELVALTGRELKGIEGATKAAIAEVIEVLQETRPSE